MVRLFFAVLVGFLVSTSVCALPLTYTFHMPAFDGGELAGHTSTLSVTADNGGTSRFDQSYLNTQIVGMSVVVGPSSWSLDDSDYRELHGSFVYITTDSKGLATLDLSPQEISGVFLYRASSVSSVQLGTKYYGTGYEHYYVRMGDLRGFRREGDVVQSVPEPSSLALMGMGLFGLGLVRRLRIPGESASWRKR